MVRWELHSIDQFGSQNSFVEKMFENPYIADNSCFFCELGFIIRDFAGDEGAFDSFGWLLGLGPSALCPPRPSLL